MENRQPSNTKYLMRVRKPIAKKNFRKSMQLSSEMKKEDYHTNLLQEKFLKIYIQAGPYSKHFFLQHINTCSSNIRERNVFSTRRLQSLCGRIRKHAIDSRIDKPTTKMLIKLMQEKEVEDALMIGTLNRFINKAAGFNIKCMSLVLAIHVSAAFSKYIQAFGFLDDFRCIIQTSNCEQLLVVYLILNIVLQMRIRDYVRAQQYLYKLVKLGWVYNFPEVELWGYLKMSIIYLQKYQLQKSQVMHDKYEEGLVEPADSKYRQYCVQKMQQQLNRIRQKTSDFELVNDDLNYKLIYKRDIVVPSEEAFNKNMKLFRRMLIRTPGQLKINNLQRVLDKVSRQRLKNQDQSLLKTNIYLNHTSKLRNLNNYFRQNNHQQQLITIEEPNKNWPLFKQMIRRISIEYAYGQGLRQKHTKLKQA